MSENVGKFSKKKNIEKREMKIEAKKQVNGWGKCRKEEEILERKKGISFGWRRGKKSSKRFQ